LRHGRAGFSDGGRRGDTGGSREKLSPRRLFHQLRFP
jgi:hypothetical protein